MPELPLSRDDPTDSLTHTTDGYVAVVVNYDNAPSECTIYPTGLDDESLVTNWVTAKEGSFVSLDEMR